MIILKKKSLKIVAATKLHLMLGNFLLTLYCNMFKYYDRIVAIVNNTTTRDQEEKNIIFVIY